MVWSFIRTSADFQDFLGKILKIVYVEMHNKAQGVRGVYYPLLSYITLLRNSKS